MKILMLLSRVPYPLEKGDKLRAFHQLRILSRQHEIFLFCLNDREIHPMAMEKLKDYCQGIHVHPLPLSGIGINLLKAWISGLPFQVGYFYSASAQKALQSVVDSFQPDHLYCQLVRTAEYVKGLNIGKTLDYQDVFSAGIARRMARAPWASRWVFRSEYRRMLRYEQAVFERFDHKTIISLADRALIPHPGREQIAVIPNGVNFDYFQPQSIDPVYDLLFTGNMAYPPNIDCAEYIVKEIMPLIHRARPETTLLIAGANPHSRVRQLENEKVTVAGWVKDMRDCYAQSRVFMAPMRIGTGLQNKLLEAMSMELACISSELANGALAATHGKEILLGNNTGTYAKHALHLLANPETARAIGKQASLYVREHFDWEQCTRELEKIMLS